VIHNILSALVSFFIVDPLQTGIQEQLAKTGAPISVIERLTACAAAAQPVLIEYYSNNPAQAATTTLRLWASMTTYQELLSSEVPACQPALAAAEPYLR
jgi:hypothetical protein